MKKNNIFKVAICMAFSALTLPFVSCNSDSLNTDGPSAEDADVNLTISTKAPADDPESQIKSLQVFAFQGDRQVAYYKADPAKLSGITHSFKMKLPQKETVFYVVANESAAGELKQKNSGNAYTISDKSTKAELENITFSTLPTNADNGIPMTSIYTTTIVKGTPVNIDNLARSVAKLNLYFAKKGDGQVYISRGAYLYNAPQYGYLFAKAYDGTDYNNVETPAAGKSGNHERGGRVILETFWPKDNIEETTTYSREQATDQFTQTKNFSVEKKFETLTGQKAIENYNHFQTQTSYIFANAGASVPYEMKIIYRKDYLDAAGKKVIEFSAPARVQLTDVKANDNVKLFAHISASTFADIIFNWQVTGWQEINQDIEFN